LKRVEARVNRGTVVVAALALIPPPFPFTPFVLAGGALGMNAWSFFSALALVRMFRFGVEGVLAHRHGTTIVAWMKTPTFQAIVGVFIAPYFASQRLMPHLGRLRSAHPDLHIDIDTGAHGLARLDEGLDAAIAITTEVDPNLYSRRIDSNRVIAIASRELMAGPNAIAHPADLARATIFLHRDLPETFKYWKEAVGIPDLQPAAEDHFDSGQLILDATAEGLGVAFMLESHLQESHDDRLVQLFDVSVESPYSYWFACRRSALSRRPVKIFHDWLFECLPDQAA
jgi:DNA-binding transcriptional LysR family regulator